MTRRHRATRTAAALALAAGFLVAGFPGLFAAPGVAAPPAAAAVQRAHLNLTTINPGVVTPASTVRLSGTVLNAGTTPLRGARVELAATPQILLTRAQVAAWAGATVADEPGAPISGGAVQLAGDLAPGERAAFQLSVPAEALAAQLGWPRSARGFGPRGIALRLAAAGSDQPLAEARSFLVWFPGKEFRPTELSVLVPVVPRKPSVDAAAADPATITQLSGSGRVARLMAATEGRRVAIAVDPALIDAASAAADPSPEGGRANPEPSGTDDTQGEGDPGTSSTSSTSSTPSPNADPRETLNPAAVQGAQTWLAELRQRWQAGEVYPLPWADPDVAALAHGDGAVLLREADQRARKAAQVLSEPEGAPGQAASERSELALALPAGPVESLGLDGDTANLIASSGRRAVLLSSAQQPLREPDGFTVTGLSTIDTQAGTLTGLLADPTLSSMLRLTGSASSAARATQRLLAELAVITLERPGDPRHLLAVAPREWDPSPAGPQAALTALAKAPWVRLQPLPDLLAKPVPQQARSQPRYPERAGQTELPADHVRAVVADRAELNRLAPALADPGPVVAPLHDLASSVVSNAWRGTTESQLATARDPLRSTVSKLSSGVRVVESSSFNVLASEAELPIRVRNDLPYATRVRLAMRSRTGVLRVPDALPIELAASEQRLLQVPVRSLANGDVSIEAQLLTPAGAPIGEPTALQVRIRRNWESRGLLFAGAALGLLLVGGMVRSARRGRIRIRAEDVPDVDDVLAAEEGAERRAAARAAADQAADRIGVGDDGTDGLMRSSAVMAAGTAVSRVLGFARIALLAGAIGAAASADAFSVANKIPNTVYMLLAGGVLNAVLVPQITRAAKDMDGGREFTDRLLTVAMTLLLAVTVLVTAATPWLVALYTNDRVSDQQLALSIAFGFWCLPQVLFYGLYTVWGQVLNARGRFAAYTWSPVVNNIVAIAGLLVFIALIGRGGGTAKPVDSWTAASIALLAGSATLGVVAQALVLLPVLRRDGFSWRPRWGIRGVGLGSAGRVAMWTFGAVALSQVGFVFVSRVLTKAGEQSRSAGSDVAAGNAIYDVGFLLFMLPHSLVVVSLVTAIFTRMSRSAVAGDVSAVRADLSLGLRISGVATIGATAAILALGPLMTAVLFPGNTRSETQGMAYAAMAMMAGLTFFSAQYLMQRAFYAYEDARTPFLITMPVVAVSTGGAVLASALVPAQWVVVGVGVAMSTANLLGAALSAAVLRRRIGRFEGRRVLWVYLRLAIAGAVAALPGWLLSRAMLDAAGGGRLGALLGLGVGGVAMLVGYGVVAWALRVTETATLVQPIVRRQRPSE